MARRLFVVGEQGCIRDYDEKVHDRDHTIGFEAQEDDYGHGLTILSLKHEDGYDVDVVCYRELLMGKVAGEVAPIGVVLDDAKVDARGLIIHRPLPHITFNAREDFGTLSLYEVESSPGEFVLQSNKFPEKDRIYLDPKSLGRLMDAAHILRHAYDCRELDEATT